MLIRNTYLKDIDQLAKLTERLGYPTWESSMKRRFTKIQKYPISCTLVAEKNGSLVGMAWLELGYHYERNKNDVRIVAFIVDTTYRKQRVGKKLLDETETWPVEQGAARLVLHSGNRAERNNAHRFYVKNDFKLGATGHYK